MSFRLTSLPGRETPAQRLSAILSQPGRTVGLIGNTLLLVTCDDDAAVAEFRAQLPHGLAIRKFRGHRLVPTHDTPHQFILEIYP